MIRSDEMYKSERIQSLPKHRIPRFHSGEKAGNTSAQNICSFFIHLHSIVFYFLLQFVFQATPGDFNWLWRSQNVTLTPLYYLYKQTRQQPRRFTISFEFFLTSILLGPCTDWQSYSEYRSRFFFR